MNREILYLIDTGQEFLRFELRSVSGALVRRRNRKGWLLRWAKINTFEVEINNNPDFTK